MTELRDKLRYRLWRLGNLLGRIRERASVGMSILMVDHDSLRPPKGLRINYMLLFFGACLLFSLPLMAFGLYVDDKMRPGDTRRQVEGRLTLLRAQDMVAREKMRLLLRMEKNLYEFRAVGRGGNEDLRAYVSENLRPKSETERDRTLRPGLQLLKDGRARAAILRTAAYHGLKPLVHRMAVYHHMPRNRPLEASYGEITSGYGYRSFAKGSSRQEFHAAVDVAAGYGTPIIATAPGRVRRADVGKDKDGYGNFVRIEHALGFTTIYAHCSDVLVKKGQMVKRGQMIARVGTTGRTTGPHVHYEVRLLGGEHLNPAPFMRLR